MKYDILFRRKNKVITEKTLINFIKTKRYYVDFAKHGSEIFIEFNGFAFFLSTENEYMFKNIVERMGSGKCNSHSKIIEFSYDKDLLIKHDICFDMISNNNRGFIYIYKTQGLSKIGYSMNVDNRYKKYVTKNPFEVKKVFEIEVNNAYDIGQKLHRLYKPKRVRGEWFDLTWRDLSDIEFLLRGEIDFLIETIPPPCNLKERLARFKKRFDID